MTRIIANTMQLLGGKPEGQPAQQTPTQQKPKTTPMPYPTEEEGDDLPFS